MTPDEPGEAPPPLAMFVLLGTWSTITALLGGLANTAVITVFLLTKQVAMLSSFF